MSRLEIEYPDLPVAGRRADIIAALKSNSVLILCGETGSGKTTQIPKMCLEAGLGEKGLIGCTQPRRIAARSVAMRVAEELKSEFGGLVGYKVRFTDKVRRDTRIKFMTDGILLAESQGNPMLSAYSCIVVDEAHERSLNIDFLLGYLRTLVELRPELKVVITSATIDAEKFSAHFNNAPVIEVSGRMYPVEIRYRPLGDEGLPLTPTPASRPTDRVAPRSGYEGAEQGSANSPLAPQGERGIKKAKEKEEADLTQAILDATDELAREGWGDTLIFLPGEREIRETAEALRKHHVPASREQGPLGDAAGRESGTALRGAPHTEILPLFARLSVEEQDRIFKPGNARRIVLATNVAETSLTVPGIRYVIDTGQARVKRYSARNKVEQLLIEKISQASCNQRAGRCGRVMDGICIRLYDEGDFNNRPRFTDPELLRSSLAGVILRMKSLNLGAVESFPFIDSPQSRFIADGYRLLHELNALDEKNELTKIGERVAKLPLDPRMARMILAAERSGCLAEMLAITSFLSVQDPRERPQDRAGSADEKHKIFADERSDFVSVVKLWHWFDEAIRHKKSNRLLQSQLSDHFLSPRRMREWRDVHGQLATQAAEMGLRLNEKPAGYDTLHQALLTGLLGNIGFKSDDVKARKPGEGGYQGARGLRFSLHPASVLAKKGPKWVVAAELTDVGRLMGRMAAEVRPEWIEAAAQHVLERSYSEPHWDRKSARVTAYERVTLYGVTLASRRRVHYGPLEPELSRELFIRGALVAGEYDTDAKWFQHNRELIAHIEELEHKARKAGVWLDEARIFAFFDARIPPGMHNGPAFEKWLKGIDTETLKLRREDIVAEGLDLSQGLYPESIQVDGVECAVKYRFEPGHPLDGATLSLPLYLLNRVSEAQLDWAIPGLLRDRVNALFKALPKEVRNALIPLAQTVTMFLSEAKAGSAPLTQTLAAWAEGRTGKKVDVREAAVDAHLRLNLRVLDDGGQELAMGRDLAALRLQLGETASLTYGQGEETSAHERDGIIAWDFGDLPASVQFSRSGQKLTGYPALLDAGDSVAMKLMDTRENAEAESRKGVVRLMRLALAPQFKQLEKDLSRQTALALKYRPFGNAETFFAELFETIAARACLGDDELPRRQKEFDKQKERTKPRIAPVTQALLKSVEECLELYQQVQARLAQKTSFVLAQKDEQVHLAGLVYAGFIRATPWERWQHLPRYLRAILKRFDKLPSAGDRDARHTAVTQGLEQRYQERLAKHRKAGVHDLHLAEFRWHLEELRVSLFAQELKTPYPVSAKRLEKLWESVQQ
jgi:ATP-dependent helicase HrpA